MVIYRHTLEVDANLFANLNKWSGTVNNFEFVDCYKTLLPKIPFFADISVNIFVKTACKCFGIITFKEINRSSTGAHIKITFAYLVILALTFWINIETTLI